LIFFSGGRVEMALGGRFLKEAILAVQVLVSSSLLDCPLVHPSSEGSFGSGSSLLDVANATALVMLSKEI
jgi:hypothetical protein